MYVPNEAVARVTKLAQIEIEEDGLIDRYQTAP